MASIGLFFADKRNNHLAGSPMVDFGKAEARYVRLTFTGGQKNGFGGAVWNVKVFGGGIEEALPPAMAGTDRCRLGRTRVAE